MENKTYWEQIYHTKECAQVSWYQLHPRLSLQYIQNTGIGKSGHIIDVGGGASTLNSINPLASDCGRLS